MDDEEYKRLGQKIYDAYLAAHPDGADEYKAFMSEVQGRQMNATSNFLRAGYARV